MNTQRLLFTVSWIVTVVVAYVLGGGLASTEHPAPAGQAVAAHPGGASTREDDAAKDGTGAKVSRQFGDAGDRGPDGKRSVKKVVNAARLAMSGGMGAFMNMRAMMRAFAPLADLDDSQIAEALAEVEKTVKEPQAQMMFYSMLLGQWAEKDGQAAMDYAKDKSTGNNMFMKGIQGVVLGSWARSNPDAAWKWYQGQPADFGGEFGGMGLNSLFAGMASANLDTALSRLDTLDESKRNGALMGIASSASTESARSRLLDRAATLPDASRQQIYNSVVGQWAFSDPDAAVKWIKTLPADQQPALRESAGQMLMMSRPEAAADLMLENAKPEDKGHIYDQVASRWAYQDPKAAGDWLSKQPQGPELDGARRSYATAVAGRDPAGAMAWATSVQDPEQRGQSVSQVYQMWHGRDAAAAEAGLKSSGLPPEKIQEILTQPAPSTTLKGPTATRVIGF